MAASLVASASTADLVASPSTLEAGIALLMAASLVASVSTVELVASPSTYDRELFEAGIALSIAS